MTRPRQYPVRGMPSNRYPGHRERMRVYAMRARVLGVQANGVRFTINERAVRHVSIFDDVVLRRVVGDAACR